MNGCVSFVCGFTKLTEVFQWDPYTADLIQKLEAVQGSCAETIIRTVASPPC